MATDYRAALRAKRPRKCETKWVATEPQPDEATPESQRILTPLTEAAIFLVLTVSPGGEEVVRELLADVSALKRSVGFRLPEGELVCVTGIGASLWDRLFGAPRPADLHPFPDFSGSKHTAPSTPGDLLFHIRAHRLDLCFELSARLIDRLKGVARVVDEVHGFRSFDERDLLGFVDGTENPDGRAASDAVVISDDEPGFAGGSYAVVQKYLHDMDAWNALTIEDQEKVIGRTKLDDIEMPDEIKPANSHVALNTIEDENGDQQQIMRFNMPFGHVGAAEFGTYFIGYAKTAALIELMLTNMFIGKPPGNYDRVLDFSTAVTGCLFFIPDAEFLDDPPPAGAALPHANTAAIFTSDETDQDAPAGPVTATAPADGSLGIGSLREDRP
jgi:putative iron-dependent peroxidase